jgi:Flp pilus assembly protein TadD
MNAFHESSAAPHRRAHGAIEAMYATGHELLSRERFSSAACVFRAMLTCAPQDERGWIALGACHEGLGQHRVALELYGAGRVLSRGGARCDLARARLLRATGQLEQAEEAMIRARRRAEAAGDHELLTLVGAEEKPS